MTPRNLAVVFAPNVLYSKDVSIEAVADSNAAVEFLVSHYEALFPVLQTKLYEFLLTCF